MSYNPKLENHYRLVHGFCVHGELEGDCDIYNRRVTTANLVELSQWIDAGNVHRDEEAVTWGRLAKVSEECGEVISKFIGATGQNPRKGITHTIDDVRAELFDVAITALGAVEHLDGHTGMAIGDLFKAIDRVAQRMHYAKILPPVNTDQRKLF